jgi:hypothetical protein
VGFLFIVFVLGLAALVVTIYGAVRAGQNSDMGWLVGIILGWVIGMGWLVALIYLVSVDPQRQGAGRLGRPDLVGRGRDVPPPDPSASAPAGWYGDPAARHEQRYWDGAHWTEHVTDGGRPGIDPV